VRDGKEQEVSATLVELAEGGGRAPFGPGGGQPGDGRGRFGLTVSPLTPELAAQLRLPRDAEGLVVTEVDPVGPAGQAGIRQGDVIQQVNRRPVRSISDLSSALEGSAGRPALLLIRREGSYYYVTIQPR
jgi:S1-C subfamily serine protease